MEGFLLLVPLLIVVAVVIRLAAGGLDHDRIREYVEQRGGQVLDANWAPLGPG